GAEEIVEADLRHLDIPAAVGERVTDEEGRACRNDESPPVEAEIVVLSFDRPVVGDRVLNPNSAQESAGLPVIGRDNRGPGGQVVDCKVVVAKPAAAGLPVEEPVIYR